MGGYGKLFAREFCLKQREQATWKTGGGQKEKGLQ